MSAPQRVLVVGAGGLGSPVLRQLATSGVAHITVIDDDVVDESNLPRHERCRAHHRHRRRRR
ncbi:MAG: ThiF family adenylyltransferase [Deltaproteobacteria bacterium]|nr:ThiF family adenylyltransferase [Deltaproteobacteria bacterium]